ncbi:MAG: shikimate dehydrogenase [Bacteroidales bacterium]|nr:shikimate dehydrogenase [Bacteroidales bacterium]
MDFRCYGLIGFPLGHSFSVPYFSNKFSREGIKASYRNFPLKSIAEFEELVISEPGLAGLNVTVPYKEKVIPYLDALSETAQTIQAVNTICFCRKEGKHTLVGHNTDVIGFERSLKEHLMDHHKAALVLGTGGSSKAVTYVLEGLGIEFRMVSRSRGEDRISYDDLDKRMVGNHPVIINTTPLGMHPDTDSFPSIPFEAITPHHLLFDLVYNPEKTAFLLKGEGRGARIVNGYDMLVYQAEASWEIWNRKR